MSRQWELQKWVAPAAPDMGHGHHDGRVDLLAEQPDFECVLLGRMGMTLKTIAKFTGLTTNQVAYRLGRAGIKTRDYRNGKGPFAQMVFGYLAKRAAGQLTKELRQIKDVEA